MSYPNDVSRLADGIGATQASRDDFTAASGPKGPARTLVRESVTVHKNAADAMAAGTTAYTAAPMLRAMRAGILLGAYFVPEDTLTADDTNFATLDVQKADGLGGAGTTMASQTTKITGGSGDFVAGAIVPLAVSATIATRRFAKGAVLGFAIEKTAGGVVVPNGTFVLDIEWESVDGYKV